MLNLPSSPPRCYVRSIRPTSADITFDMIRSAVINKRPPIVAGHFTSARPISNKCPTLYTRSSTMKCRHVVLTLVVTNWLEPRVRCCATQKVGCVCPRVAEKHVSKPSPCQQRRTQSSSRFLPRPAGPRCAIGEPSHRIVSPDDHWGGWAGASAAGAAWLCGSLGKLVPLHHQYEGSHSLARISCGSFVCCVEHSGRTVFCSL